MRTTRDLIEELEVEAKKASVVVLAVGFDDHTIVIAADQPNRQELLDEAVINGGVPVGLVRGEIKANGHELVMSSRVFPEHPPELGLPFMSRFVAAFAEVAKERYPGARVLPPDNSQ